MLGGIILIKGLKSRKKKRVFFPLFCLQRPCVANSLPFNVIRDCMCENRGSNEKFTVRNCPVTDGYGLAAWVLLNTRITTDGLDLGKARCTVLVTQFQRYSFVASR